MHCIYPIVPRRAEHRFHTRGLGLMMLFVLVELNLVEDLRTLDDKG